MFLLLLIVSAFFAAIFPLMVIFFMVKMGVILDVYASERRTRTKPFLVAITSYLLGIIILTILGAPQSLVALMACYFVNSLVMVAISQVWKISIHTSGITGPATFLVHQLGLWMLPFFALIFPVGWSRVKLGAHDLSQLAAGALLTIGLTLVQLEIYLK